MTAPVNTPPSKTALVAIRQFGSSFEAFDSEGASLGIAASPEQLWDLLGRAMDSVPEVEMPTPEQVTLENMVRETGATIGSFLEQRHPGVTKLMGTFLRGATIAKRQGYFDEDNG